MVLALDAKNAFNSLKREAIWPFFQTHLGGAGDSMEQRQAWVLLWKYVEAHYCVEGLLLYHHGGVTHFCRAWSPTIFPSLNKVYLCYLETVQVQIVRLCILTSAGVCGIKICARGPPGPGHSKPETAYNRILDTGNAAADGVTLTVQRKKKLGSHL